MIEVWRVYACSINHYIVSLARMLFLRNFERFNNLHAYHRRVGGNQLPPVNLLLPRMTGRNMRPHVIYFTKLAAITIKVGALLQDEGPWFFTLFSREKPPYHFRGGEISDLSPPLTFVLARRYGYKFKSGSAAFFQNFSPAEGLPPP